jgi:hypothetical protein
MLDFGGDGPPAVRVKCAGCDRTAYCRSDANGKRPYRPDWLADADNPLVVTFDGEVTGDA